MNKRTATRWIVLFLLLGSFGQTWAQAPTQRKSFPAKIPSWKPTDRPLSAAVERLYDRWNPREDRGNELYSNFKYSPLEGFESNGSNENNESNTSRRDPSKVLRIDGTYHVWYTRRQTAAPPSGPQNATATIPSFDWDLADIWHAVSQDGFHWVERGPAVKRLPKGQYGWRSVSTPDVLVFDGKYYLYYQGFNEIPGLQGDRAAATVAEADSPDGPWRPLGRVVVDFGADGEWDAGAIHDPYPLVYRGKIYLYYKGSPGKQGADNTLVRAQGLAVADHPLGPFVKCPLNPVLNSGHETCLWPWKEGIAAIVSLDGPEKNTVQYAPDGVNFRMMSILQIPPIAPGPFVPDVFAADGNGRGLTWGLCHINPDGGGATRYSILARFDCDLSLDVDRPAFKHNNLRFDERTYFQDRVKLPGFMLQRIQRERDKVDRGVHGHLVETDGGPIKHPYDRFVPGPTAEEEPNVHESSSDGVGMAAPILNQKPFPSVMPVEKPADRALSASWSRMWDRWNPREDRGNELYSNFRYTPLGGFSREPNVSRRDPSKVLKIDGTYYVWYTCRRSESPPVGLENATDTIPGTDWDLSDIWYATSRDGFTWEEQGPAVRRPARPARGFRSICTPDVLVFGGKYYLYFQAYSPMVGGRQHCPVMAAVADSPQGPWRLVEKPVIEPGPPGSWDNIKINDPYLLVHRGKIRMYYKGAPIERGEAYVLRMQGTAWAADPLGPFVKSPLNPVINSGHETCMWPWKSGIAALIALDGPEKNTIQYAADGENFEIMSILQVPPIAPGPFIPDAFADSGDGRGFTWGLCHINPDGGGATHESILARFDCDLSRDVERPLFKRNNLRFEASTYFQPQVLLPEGLRRWIDRQRDEVDRDTLLGQHHFGTQ